MTTKFSKFDREHAEESLRELIKENDTVYTILKHVSSSGMMRIIEVVVLKYDEERKEVYPYHIGYNTACLLDDSWDRDRHGVKVTGCGMDMGFDLVYRMASRLFGDGYKLKQSWL